MYSTPLQQQHEQQQQYQQHAQQQPQHQTDSLDGQLQHLRQQQAQLEAMRILQQQHMLPNIVTPKQDDLGLIQNQPSGPWSSDDYDSMMRTILDATLPSDHFTDLEAPASLASFSASYAASFVSGSSDSGASPNGINDLVYGGAASFPTPPDSDIGSSARNFSFSLAPNNGAAISPDASLDFSNASYAQSYSGSDTTSPYAHNFNMHASSSTSPFGLQNVQLPPASLSPNGASPMPTPQHPDLSASSSQQWNNTFLAPNSAQLQPSPSAQVTSPQQSTETSQPPVAATSINASNVASRKRRAADAKPETKKASVSAAASKAEPAEDARKTKKVKPTVLSTSTVELKAASSSTAAPISKLPHMEVGSNATALAAIERLKAKRLQESQAAAQAAREAAASAHGSSQTSTQAASADRAQLDPATRQQKKVAHNAIERRYRNNINDRIAALRRAVPALREIRPRKTPSGRRSRKAQQEEDLVDGVPAATKLNKATILGKATDYIRYLKSRELRLTSEVAGLRELVRSLEGGEELLELWEAEMDKVVAEQEALAAAAAAKEEEEEEAEQAPGIAEADDDDDEDEEADDDDEEVDTAESSYASASSSSPPSARSRNGSKGGRGRKSGIAGAISSVASSRYMLATFLGISFIGSGTEFALDATASDASQAVGRPATAKVMVGASRQLLKRSATYMAPATSIAQDPHAFDAVPTHALAFEVLRVVSFAFCFLFLVWPLFSRLFASRSAPSTPRISDVDEEQDESETGQSRNLRLALAKGEMDVATFDKAVRAQVAAPTSAFLAMPSLTLAASRLALTRSSRINSLLPAQNLADDDAAALSRLLEVETLCEAKSQPSWSLRLHTALRLANSIHVRGGRNVVVTRDPVLAAPRLKATLALSLARLGEGVDAVQDLADQLWTDARACLRGASSSSTEATSAISPSASDKDESLAQSQDASWLSCVLSLDLDTALDMLASASSDPRNYDFSAVLAIADVYYCTRLTAVWNRLLNSLVRASCPSSSDADTHLVRDFVALQAKHTLDLDVIRDADQRKQLHTEITTLARTASPTACAWQMAQVTLATWSAVLGNVALARHVGLMLGESPFSDLQLASVGALHAFVAAEEASEATAAYDELDAKANLFIGWLSFLRTYADARTGVKRLHGATLQVRKLVAAVTAVTVDEEELEASLDVVTDLCTALGRKVNRLPQEAGRGSVAKLLTDTADDDRDSGIEV